MKYLRKESIALPDTSEGWTIAAIGFSLTEMRVLSYFAVGAFFAINGLCAYLIGFSYFDGLTEYITKHSIFAATAYVVCWVVGYYALHEAIHVLFHPDHGISNKTMFGFQAAAFFVIYNGIISKSGLQRVVLAPFLILTPLCFLVLISTQLKLTSIDAIFIANLFGLHLTACSGDLMLYRKLKNSGSFSWLWNAYTSSWTK